MRNTVTMFPEGKNKMNWIISLRICTHILYMSNIKPITKIVMTQDLHDKVVIQLCHEHRTMEILVPIGHEAHNDDNADFHRINISSNYNCVGIEEPQRADCFYWYYINLLSLVIHVNYNIHRDNQVSILMESGLLRFTWKSWMISGPSNYSTGAIQGKVILPHDRVAYIVLYEMWCWQPRTLS